MKEVKKDIANPTVVQLLVSPNVTASTRFNLVVVSVIFFSFITVWHFFTPAVVPRIQNIFSEMLVLVTEKGMLYELSSTFGRVFKAMLFSVLLAAAISFFGNVINLVRPIAKIIPYFRFWSTLGFAPIIRNLASSGDSFQLYMLMFGIVPFLVTSFNSVLRDVDNDPLYDYSRTLGYKEWTCVWFVVVRSKLSKIYVAIRNNFAIAWVMAPYIEIANRDGGGIGAMLFDYVRYVPGEDPYAAAAAIQVMVLLCGVFADYLFKKLVLTLPEESIKQKER